MGPAVAVASGSMSSSSRLCCSLVRGHRVHVHVLCSFLAIVSCVTCSCSCSVAVAACSCFWCSLAVALADQQLGEQAVRRKVHLPEASPGTGRKGGGRQKGLSTTRRSGGVGGIDLIVFSPAILAQDKTFKFFPHPPSPTRLVSRTGRVRFSPHSRFTGKVFTAPVLLTILSPDRARFSPHSEVYGQGFHRTRTPDNKYTRLAQGFHRALRITDEIFTASVLLLCMWSSKVLTALWGLRARFSLHPLSRYHVVLRVRF